MGEIKFNKSVHKDLCDKIAAEVEFCLENSSSFFDDCFWGQLIQERAEYEYFSWDKTILISGEGLYILEFSILASPFEFDENDEDAKIPEYEISSISCRKA